MAREHPVGKAQQVILDALALEADSFKEANKIFEDMGLAVIPVRQGLRSVPQVHLLDTVGGGFNAHGEGEAYDILYEDINLEPIAEWMAHKK